MNRSDTQERTESGVGFKPALELHSVTKSFGYVTALNDVDLVVREGDILGIVGDNGAGKSTLLKILSGLHPPDTGEIQIFGEAVRLRSPQDAKAKGIATVYQDLGLVDCLDVATNMALGDMPRRHLLVDSSKMLADAAAVLAELDIRVKSLRTPVGLLSGGERQVVAIARAVRLDGQIVLLDEPTAALGVRETAHVGEILSNLRDRGKTVACISHDMQFAFDHMDRIAVMRLGRVVAMRERAKTTREEIIGLITGAIAPDASTAQGQEA
jgi:ABC-type sugar transport system ATPase subunit